MNLGPVLPARELAVALAALRMRTAAARAGAIFRLHPAGSAVPVLLLSAVVAVFVMTSVSVRIVATPQAAGRGPGDGLLPSPSPVAGGLGGQQAQPVAVRSLPGQAATSHARQRGVPATWPGMPRTTPASGTGGSPQASIAATMPVPVTSSPVTSAAPSGPAPPSTPEPTPSEVPSPTQTRYGHGPSTGNCVTIGFLQVCLSL